MEQAERTATQAVYRDEFIGLRVDTVRNGPGGAPYDRRVVEYHPAAVLVPFNERRTAILLTRQYRYPVDRMLWELPGGMIEQGESPQACAIREFEEETGHCVIGEAQQLNSFYPEPAFSDHRIDLFAAKASDHPSARDQRDDDIADCVWTPVGEALRLIQSGDIASSWSVIGVLTFARLLDRDGVS